MDNKKIEQEFYDQTDILSVIQLINNSFADVYLKKTLESLKKINYKIDDDKLEQIKNHCQKGPDNYYLYGHCVSYSNILSEIFGDHVEKYNSDEHIIVKIDGHFYDVRGLIDDVVKREKFHKTEIGDLFYIDINFGIKDELENPIEKELINIGKNKLITASMSKKTNYFKVCFLLCF